MSSVLLLCQSESNLHAATMKATDSVCDLRVTFAFIVFTQAGNVLMGTPTIVRMRGAALCSPDPTYICGLTHSHTVHMLTHTTCSGDINAGMMKTF